MKYIIFVFVFSISSVIAQNPDESESGKLHRSANEINYRLPFAVGYNHIHNFNDKLLLGGGIHLGVSFYLYYIDLLHITVLSRNIFNRNKFDRRFDYDIGLFYSYPYF